MVRGMVGEMVQNLQRLYSFAFNAIIIIHQYIYSHSAIKFLFKKYIYSHRTTYLLFTNVFTPIYGMYLFRDIQRFIFIHIHDRNISSARNLDPRVRFPFGQHHEHGLWPVPIYAQSQ